MFNDKYLSRNQKIIPKKCGDNTLFSGFGPKKFQEKTTLSDKQIIKWGKYIGKDKKWHHGKYLFTVDFAHPESNILDTDHSEIPHEHKCAHIIALDDGNFAAQPNNRCIWDIPSFTVKDNIPDWKVQTNEWNVEDTSQWRTEDTDKFFYEIEEKKK